MSAPPAETATIMIVDDIAASRQLLGEVLQRRGYQVAVFPGGEPALRAARLAPPDLILLDIDMPAMNGCEVCERLKADAALRDIPVIFVSGLGDVVDKVKAFREGGVDFITKPFEAEEVAARVRVHLALRRHERRLQAELAERRRVEAALRASEQRCRDLFEHAPVGIFHSTIEGRFLDANPALAVLLGYASPAELIAATSDMAAQIYAEPGRRKEIVAALLEREGWHHYEEVAWRRRDGRLITVDMTGRAVREPAGSIAYLEGFIVDITQRKAAEAALRASEQMFRTLVETLPLMIFVERGAPDHQSEYLNPAFTRMTGYTLEDIPHADQWWTMAYPDAAYGRQCRDEWYRRIHPAIQAGIPIEPIETAIICKDGSRKVLSLGFIPLGGKNFVFGVDQTERQRAEAAVRASERLFRTLVEFLPLILYVCEGPEEKSVYVNPAFTRLVGYALEDLPVAKKWWELAYPDPVYREAMRVEWLRREQRSRETQTPSEPMETTVTCKDGSRKHFLAGYIPLAGRKYIFASDITARKQAEAELARVLAVRTEEWRQATSAALGASEEEARRIGHELHDTLCQDLAGIACQAQSLALAGAGPDRLPDPLAERLRRLGSLAAAAARQARGLSHLLAISEPWDGPFEEVLAGHLRQLQDLYGIVCEPTFGEGLPAWSQEQGTHLIRIVREAVVNAARHAQARRAWVDCLRRGGQTVISISSDGVPSAHPEAWQPGLGLRQMRMRAALLGASLILRAGAEGAVVQLDLPDNPPA